jgi:DNA polymerase III epsilon subunit
MREIVFDTETTGLDPLSGHRVVEIGCVELFNRLPTGKTFHSYLNPGRSMPTEASMVHGLTDEFLADKPMFAEVVDDFLSFIADSPLVAHNAGFDMGFINAELTRTGYAILPKERAIDTVLMARKMFPGAPASLDAEPKKPPPGSKPLSNASANIAPRVRMCRAKKNSTRIRRFWRRLKSRFGSGLNAALSELPVNTF